MIKIGSIKSVEKAIIVIDDLISQLNSYRSLIDIDDPDTYQMAAPMLEKLVLWESRLFHKISNHVNEEAAKSLRELFTEIWSDFYAPKKSFFSFFSRSEDTDKGIGHAAGFCVSIMSIMNEQLLTIQEHIELSPELVFPELYNGMESTRNVFVSYAWQDKQVVGALDQWLRNRGLIVKIDERDFFAGSRIRDEIVRVMNQSHVVLIIYSANSQGRAWTDFERELAQDLEIEAKKEASVPPRIIYVVLDKTPLKSISERNRLAVFASGRKFQEVCEAIYNSIMQVPKKPDDVDLSDWDDYVF